MNPIDQFIIRYQKGNNPSQAEIEKTLKFWHSKAKYRISVEFFRNEEIPENVLTSVRNGNLEGMLWITDQRIFFATSEKKNFLAKPNPIYRHFFFPSIASIEFRRRSTFGVYSLVVIHTSTISAHGNVAKTVYECLNEPSFVEAFVLEARKKIGVNAHQVNDNPPSLSTAQLGTELISKLKELGELKTQGILSDSEFEKAKKKLLS